MATLVCALMVAGCGGPTEQDLVRSQREFELAVGLLGEGNVPGAFDHLFTAVRLDSANFEAHLLLGNLFLVRGDYSRSEHHLREVLRIRRREPRARNSLGVLYIHMRRYDAAIRELRLATSDILNREPWLAWGNLGWAYTERGRYRDAIEALLQSVRNQPNFCVGFYRLGDVYFRSHQLDRADEALTRAVEIDDPGCRRMQDAFLLRGKVRLQQGESDAAVSDLQRCVEIAQRSDAGSECQRLLDRTQSSPPPDQDSSDGAPDPQGGASGASEPGDE